MNKLFKGALMFGAGVVVGVTSKMAFDAISAKCAAKKNETSSSKKEEETASSSSNVNEEFVNAKDAVIDIEATAEFEGETEPVVFTQTTPVSDDEEEDVNIPSDNPEEVDAFFAQGSNE